MTDLANHLAGLESWPEAWREHTHAIEKGFRKHLRNGGHRKEEAHE